MNFYLAAQTMEWSTYPIILCVCLCMCLLVFHLSDCVKRERRVKWYLVPVCHIVCGLFATLCTGPQGHTHYDINSCQLFCQRWNAHWPHARVLCIDACVGVCQCLQFYIILIYTFILHIQINQRCYKTHIFGYFNTIVIHYKSLTTSKSLKLLAVQVLHRIKHPVLNYTTQRLGF